MRRRCVFAVASTFLEPSSFCTSRSSTSAQWAFRRSERPENLSGSAQYRRAPRIAPLRASTAFWLKQSGPTSLRCPATRHTRRQLFRKLLKPLSMVDLAIGLAHGRIRSNRTRRSGVSIGLSRRHLAKSSELHVGLQSIYFPRQTRSEQPTVKSRRML